MVNETLIHQAQGLDEHQDYNSIASDSEGVDVMALKLTIRPNETIYINGAEICNSGSASHLVLKNQCRFMRESDMIFEGDVKSPCSRLVYVLQQIVIKDNTFDELNELSKLVVQILQVLPSLAPKILEIQSLLSEQKTHMAFKKGKALLAFEEAFLADTQGVQRVG